MKIVGCDLHARQQSIAMVDTETGEFLEKTVFMFSPDWGNRLFRLIERGHSSAARRIRQPAVLP